MSFLTPTTWFKKKDSDDSSIENSLSASTGGAPQEPDDEYPQPFLPSISALPKSRLSVLSRRRAIKRSMAITLTTLAVVGVSIAGLVVTMIAAKDAEATAKAAEEDARTEVEALMPVRDLYEGFEARQRAVANALSSDIDFYSLITGIQDAIQDEIPRDALMEDEDGTLYVKENYSHIELIAYSVEMTPCPSDQPFDTEASLGCIKGNAYSSSYAQAGKAIALLNEADNGLFGGYIISADDQKAVGDGNSAVGSTAWSFSINFGVGALSGKYNDLSEAILGAGQPVGEDAPMPMPSGTPEPGSLEPDVTPTTEGDN